MTSSSIGLVSRKILVRKIISSRNRINEPTQGKKSQRIGASKLRSHTGIKERVVERKLCKSEKGVECREASERGVQ